MKKIGKYEIVEELGSGGMGVVYKAYDTGLEREVAVKVIKQTALDVPESKARFYREARMAARLSHDAIAIIYEIGEDEGLPFIAMEYLPGGDLRALIDKKEVLSLEQKLDYARQVCRGLQYAHSKNVIHRDIKPENIKLLGDGRVKIIDFGIAKPYVPTTLPEEKSTSAVLTRLGMRIGTPWYMSPEQVKGIAVDKRTDIFSFGVVLYELLTYKRPFQGDDTTVLYKILHVQPEPIKLDESGLTDDLQRILSRCLAKEHEERYADCSLVLKDLMAVGMAPSADPRIAILLSQGAALDKAERYDEAARKFTEVLEIDPQNEQARSFLKRLALRDKESFMRRVLAGTVIGTVISHFQIQHRIGGGGMGVVYRAEDISLRRTVALKFLMPDLIRDPSAQKRFLKEAQAASALDHPNICTIHEVGETDEGLLFICMAYYGGENLSAKLQRGPLQVPEALDIVIRIGRGLAKAHEHGIVHRDIKPANIIITSAGEVKIVDFGLAKLSGATKITRVGARMGTLPFMSPEQIQGVEVDFHTDIWSLAVLLFEALTGHLPFEREYEAAMLYAIVADDPTLLTSVNSALPIELEKVITKGLRKEPSERYESMQSMVDELERILGAMGVVVLQAADVEALLREARDLLMRGKYTEALLRLDKVSKVAPSDVRVGELRDAVGQKLKEAEQVTMLLREGTALFDKGKFKEARDVLRDVIAVQPTQVDASRILAKANEHLERSEQIEKLLAEAKVYVKHDKFGPASDAYRGVLQLDRSNKEALRGLEKAQKAQSDRPRKTLAGSRVLASASFPRRYAWWALGGLALALVVVGVILLIPRGKPAPGVTAEKAAPVDSSGPAAAARNSMLAEKMQAASAKAESLDKSGYNQAVLAERKGEGEFASGAYGAATRSFGEAGTLFKKSAQEAKAESEAATEDLSHYRDRVSAVRKEMLDEKENAIRIGGRSIAGSLFDRALTFEHAGDTNVNSDDREALQASRTSYLSARDGYKSVVEEVNRLSALKKAADVQLESMSAAKQSVPGSDQEKRSSAKYRGAIEAETSAKSLYQSKNYAQARDGFARAQGLFTDAASDVGAGAPTVPVTPPENKPPEKKEPVKTERDERGALISEILDAYRKSFEEGNAHLYAGLLKASRQEERDRAEKGVEEFFQGTQDRTVTIGQVTLQSDLVHASAKVTRKWVSKAELDKVEESPNDLMLEFVNGHWAIASVK